MTTQRDIEAYRRRLAKVDTAYDLTGECLDAVIAWADFADGEPVIRCGALAAFRVYTGPGLLGPCRYVDVTICTACVGEQASERQCGESEISYTIFASTLVDLYRNEDDVRALVAKAFPELIA